MMATWSAGKILESTETKAGNGIHGEEGLKGSPIFTFPTKSSTRRVSEQHQESVTKLTKASTTIRTPKHQTFQGRKRETQNIFGQNMSVDPVTPNNILLGSQKIVHPRIVLFRTRTALIRAMWYHLRLPQDNATQQQVPHAVTVYTGSLHTAFRTCQKHSKIQKTFKFTNQYWNTQQWN